MAELARVVVFGVGNGFEDFFEGAVFGMVEGVGVAPVADAALGEVVGPFFVVDHEHEAGEFAVVELVGLYGFIDTADTAVGFVTGILAGDGSRDGGGLEFYEHSSKF